MQETRFVMDCVSKQIFDMRAVIEMQKTINLMNEAIRNRISNMKTETDNLQNKIQEMKYRTDDLNELNCMLNSMDDAIQYMQNKIDDV